jgi:membrane carboxypeptidase/penicillin-binding protein PbpC
VVLRAETGEILTLLGSVNFWDATIDGNFNVATAERQPGSTFKPFVYLTAFLTPLDPSTIVTPATLLSDVRLEFNVGGQTYIPQNIDRQYHGPVSVRKALGNSYNIPTVQVLNWIGISPLLRTAHRMGINSLNAPLSAYGLSLALGAGEVTPLDLTYAYNVFATQGYAVGVPVHSSEARQGYRQLNPTSLLRIEDKNGRVLWEFSEAKGTFDRRLVIPQGMAYLMTDLLSDPEARLPSFPRGNPLELSRPAAAKTGTTDDNRDAWAVGYTPFYTTTVWVGNNDNTSMSDITGLTGAAPIWHALMEYLHLREGLPPTGWTRPTTVVEQTVCLWSGLLPTPNCPQVPRELFYVDPANGVDYRPQKTDNAWYRLAIDVCNNSRANDTTPPQCLEERIFFDFPPEFEAWAMANAPELIPPQQEGIIREGSAFSPVAIVAPRFPDQIRATVEIFGNTNLEDLNYYQIGYGEGNEPTAFIQIGQNGTTRGFNQALATWDTTGLTDGVYTLRLQVIRAGNRIETASTRVTVDNTPPEVRLISPLGGTQISFGQSGVLSLEAEVFDSGAVQRVEFYVDALDKAENVTEGIKIGESQTYPYSYVWALDPRALGTRTFWAVAYDRAGNATTSNRTSLTLAP